MLLAHPKNQNWAAFLHLKTHMEMRYLMSHLIEDAIKCVFSFHTVQGQ